MKPFAAPILLVFSMLLAGCAEHQTHAKAVVETPQAATGDIVGRVLDEELVPIVNASVAVAAAGLELTTGPDGAFSFPDLEVGTHGLVVAHARYESATKEVLVRADETTVANVTLVLLPDFRPFNLTTPFEGSFDCAFEAAIVTGPCWTLVEGSTCRAGTCVEDPVLGSKYQFAFDVNPRWQTVLAEVVWTAGGDGLDGMRLYVENANASEQGLHGKGVAKVHGDAQPLVARIDRGVTAEGAETYDGTSVAAFIPDEGGRQQIRVFPKGNAYETTSQACVDGFGCFLGVGGGLNVRFTVYLTVFYNERAPDGWSAVPPQA